MAALDLGPITDEILAAVRSELGRWEQATARPRMLRLEEAGELLGVSDQQLRKLAPALGLPIDRSGQVHTVSSVFVYRIIEAGGIGAVLSGTAASPSSSDHGEGVTGAPESAPTPARKARVLSSRPGLGRPHLSQEAS